MVHEPSPAIGDLRTTLFIPLRRRFIRIQTAKVNAAKRLLRGVGLNSGPRGSLRTAAHWQRLRAGDVVPEELKQHVRHPYAVRSQAAERVRALDPSFGESACARRDAVKRNGPGRGSDRRAHRDRGLCRWQPL